MADSASRILIDGARAAYVGPSLKLAPHRVSVAVAAIGIERAFCCTMFAAAPVSRMTRLAIVPPGARHHIDAQGMMAFVYLDAASDDYAALAQKLACAGDAEAAVAHDACAALARTMCAPAALMDALARVLHLPPRPQTDAALASIIRALHDAPQRFDSVRDAALLAGASSRHFQRAFTRATGVPFRRYRAWARLRVVAMQLRDGATLTSAAHDAGFSSSAHFSATFRAMFGLSASTLLKNGAVIEMV
ncbi:MAG: AraC family transcriptional regulator [Hyphomonadaceae bacterium]|nr:AraC family transcriptional regulator [Hyphomonadaceae bacterium]